jgi:hypothetical protein
MDFEIEGVNHEAMETNQVKCEVTFDPIIDDLYFLKLEDELKVSAK